MWSLVDFSHFIRVKREQLQFHTSEKYFFFPFLNSQNKRREAGGHSQVNSDTTAVNGWHTKRENPLTGKPRGSHWRVRRLTLMLCGRTFNQNKKRKTTEIPNLWSAWGRDERWTVVVVGWNLPNTHPLKALKFHFIEMEVNFFFSFFCYLPSSSQGERQMTHQNTL